jgi:DNA-binding MarR family transcriptional regulator
LRLIQHEGPLTASDLADETGFTRASLSVVVEKLSQRGLINREQDREDRRRWLLSTSKSVTDKIDENYAFHAARVEALLESYSEEEFQLVLQFMTSLSQELKIAAIEFRNSVKRD